MRACPHPSPSVVAKGIHNVDRLLVATDELPSAARPAVDMLPDQLRETLKKIDALTRLQARRPALEKVVPPPAQIGRGHAQLAGHRLQRLAPQHPQDGLLLAPSRNAPLPHRRPGRSDICGLRARGASSLLVGHLDTSSAFNKPSGMSQRTLGRGRMN